MSPETNPPDPTPGEVQRFEPRPGPRAHLVAVFEARTKGEGPLTPERWFEHNPAGGSTPEAPPRSIGPGLIALLLATSLIAAFLGAGGTYAALRASGALKDPSPTATAGPQLRIESDASIVIAAATSAH